MALIIQKFGGSSVGTLERIEAVADRVQKAYANGDQIVVVLSAMQGETDRLIGLANALANTPASREFDAVVATGEQVSTALLSIALIAKGVRAKSYTGWQAGIRTDSIHKKARIEAINPERLLHDIQTGVVPVVTGFQGITEDGNISTLGRGGSDTTAVAIAAALNADECQIYTDVDGVYTSDPRVVPYAKRMNTVTFEEMLELASLGAKVLQIRSVEFAGKYNVPLRVLSTFVEGPGTLISYEEVAVEQAMVSGIAFDRNQAKISILGVPNNPGAAHVIVSAISDQNIDIDMIVQNAVNQEGAIDFSFTVMKDDFIEAMKLIEAVAEKLGARQVVGDDKVAKLSIVGVGMKSHAGVASTMFEALAGEGINIHLISTSEIKVSVVISEKYVELGARTLHTTFGLDSEGEKGK